MQYDRSSHTDTYVGLHALNHQCVTQTQAYTTVAALQIAAEVEAAAVTHDIVGISFSSGIMSSVLPAAPEDEALLAPPYELRVLQQPQKRARRRALTNFKILTLHTPPAPAESELAPADEGPVPALNLEATTSAALGSIGGNSRPASSRSGAGGVAGEGAQAAAHTTPSGSGSKAGSKGRGSHAAAAAKASRSPSVLEEVAREPEAET